MHPQREMATSTSSHAAPIPAQSLKGSPRALTGDAGDTEAHSPSNSVLTEKSPVPTNGAGTRHRGPLQPDLPGGTFLPMPSQHLGSSRIAGPSPGKRCRLLLFLPCNNIFPAQNNIGKVVGLLLLFQARLPLLPQPRRIPPAPQVTPAQGSFSSPGSSTPPCPIHPRHPCTPRVGFHRSRLPSWGVPQEGQRRARRAPGCAADAPSPHGSKLPFPLLQEPLLEARAEGKERLEVQGRAGDAATPAPTARCLPLWLPQTSPAARATGHVQPRLMRSEQVASSCPDFVSEASNGFNQDFLFLPSRDKAVAEFVSWEISVSVSNLEEEQNNQLKK